VTYKGLPVLMFVWYMDKTFMAQLRWFASIAYKHINSRYWHLPLHMWV